MHALAQGSAQIVDAIAALRAGEDVLLGTADDAALERLEEGLAQAQRRGLVDADDDAAATRRLGELRRWLGRDDQPPLDVVGCADHQALAAELARRSITLVRNDDRLLPLNLAADARIAVVQSMPADLTPADTSSTVPPTLAAALRRRLAGVEEILLPATPAEADIAGLGERLAPFDLVVVGTFSAHLQPAQAALAAAVLASGKPTVTVALRTPWDLLAYPSARTHICSYGILPPSMEALAAALLRRDAVRRPVARRHRRSASTRSRAHGMGLRDEILEQPAAAQRLLDAAPTAFAPISAAVTVAPAPVRRHRRPRHLGQRRHLRAVPAGDPQRLDRRPGGAVDDHALRRAPEHGRRAGRRHLAVRSLTGHRRGGRRGAAAGRADRRADQRRGLAPGRHGRPRGRPARRTGAGDGRDQDLHDRAARGGAAVDGARPALARRNGRSGRPARPDRRQR